MKRIIASVFLLAYFFSTASAEPAFSPDFTIDNSQIVVDLDGLDPQKRYWVILFDPTTQDIYQSQYFSYQTVGGLRSTSITFDPVNAENLRVGVYFAQRGAPQIAYLDLKAAAASPNTQANPTQNITIKFKEPTPIILPNGPVMLEISGFTPGVGYIFLVFDAAIQTPTQDRMTDYKGFSTLFGNTSTIVGANIRQPGRYKFQVYEDRRGAPLLAETVATVITRDAAQSATRTIPELTAQDFSSLGVPEDEFLDRYTGEWPCGSLQGNPFVLDITRVTEGFNYAGGSGRYYLLNDRNSIIYSGEISLDTLDRRGRTLNLTLSGGYDQFRADDKLESWYPGTQVRGQFSPKFDSVDFNFRAQNCEAVTLSAMENSPAPMKQPPAPGTFEAYCADTSSLSGASRCIEAALLRNQSENGRLNDFNLREWKQEKLFFSNCQSLTDALSDLTSTITRDYYVEFERTPRDCAETFEILEPLGYKYPVPDACQNINSVESVGPCISGIVDFLETPAPILSLLRRDVRSCQVEGGSPGNLQNLLATYVRFEGVYSSRRDSQFRARVDCTYFNEAAAAVGLISAEELDRRKNEAESLQAYANSDERAASRPNRLEMINALGREIARQCDAGFRLSQWLGGQAPSANPLSISLFEFNPTEKTCEMRLKLSSIAAAPAYVIWAGGYEDTTCSPAPGGGFDCNGTFLLGFSSNDTRAGAGMLEALLGPRRSSALSARFRLNRNTSQWDVSNISAR